MRVLVCTFLLLFVEINIFDEGSAAVTTYVIQQGKVVEMTKSDTDVAEEESVEKVDDASPKDFTLTQDGWFQGICNKRRRPLIYTENFIFDGDNKSQIVASMHIKIGGKTTITCVEVMDRSNSTKSPQILRGGIGTNNVKLAVAPVYGKGFDFTVKLYGFYK